MMLILVVFLLITGRRASGEEEEKRAPTCPKPFEKSRCLGTSGIPGAPPPKKEKKNQKEGGGEKGGEDCGGEEEKVEREKIVWEAGMGGHSHYTIVPEKTAVLVIDPQLVYQNCPKKKEEEELTIEALIAPPPTGEKEGEGEGEEFDGHSPLCCEQFGEVVGRVNRVVRAVREGGGHVVHLAHVYRDLDGDGELDNDNHSLTGWWVGDER